MKGEQAILRAWLMLRVLVTVRWMFKRASGKDLLSSEASGRTWAWASTVFRQAVDRCRPRVALQEWLMELAGIRMFEFFGLAPVHERRKPLRDKKAQSMQSALRDLAPEHAMRVVGFLDAMRQARGSRNVRSLEQALHKCNSRMLPLLAPSSTSSSNGLATSILGGKVKLRRADVLSPVATALEEALAQAPGSRQDIDPLLTEAVHLKELRVPEYLSSSALVRLLDKSIMSSDLEVFDALSCEHDLGELEVQEGLVPLVDDKVLMALADHAGSLRTLALRCSQDCSAACVKGLLYACGPRLLELTLAGVQSMVSSTPAAARIPSSSSSSSSIFEVSTARRMSGGEVLLSEIPYKRLSQLMVLRLRQAPLSDAMLVAINAALHGHLKELDLSFCIQITDSSLHHVLQKQERLEVLGCDGCDQLVDRALLALCARTWRLFNVRRKQHPVPLYFFDHFMSENYRKSNEVVVQVLPPNWQAGEEDSAPTSASASAQAAGGARKEGFVSNRDRGLWHNLDPQGRDEIPFQRLRQALIPAYPAQVVDFLFSQMQRSVAEQTEDWDGDVQAEKASANDFETTLNFVQFQEYFWEVLEAAEDHERFCEALGKV